MTATAATPGIGHNQPGGIERSRELTVSANKAVRECGEGIANKEQAGLLQELLVQLRSCSQQIDDEMKAERKPHDDAIAQIRMKYRDAATLVGIALDRVRQMLTPWLQAEDRRLQQEATERRLAAEAAARAAEKATTEALQTGTIEASLEARKAIEQAEQLADAAAKPAPRAQVKGDLAPRAMSLVPRWHAEIIDEERALKHFSSAAEIRRATLAAIKTLASRLARELKDEKRAPPGIKFVREETAR